MNTIPETPATLLDTLARQEGQTDANWSRFDALYRPVIRQFICQKGYCSPSDVEDVTQDVFLRLFTAFSDGAYQRDKGHVHSYLSFTVRNILIDRLRERQKKPQSVSLEALPAEAQTLLTARLTDPLAMEQLDHQWQEACYQAALRHILAKTPLPAGHREIFLETVHHDDTATIAARHQVTPEVVCQIKCGVDEKITAYAKFLAENA